jgi:hypothetical protein
LEVNLERRKYILESRDQNANQIKNRKQII